MLIQTFPSYSPVCPGDKLELTCISNQIAIWTIPNDDGQITTQLTNGTISTFGGLMLNITDINGSTVTSIGIYQSVFESMNGTKVGCYNLSLTQFDTLTISITGLI